MTIFDTTMRKRISANIRWKRFILLAIGLLILYSWINILLTNPGIEPLAGELLLMGVCALLYYQYDMEKTVEFDESCMYIIDKKGEKQIPLRNVIKIRPIMNGSYSRSMWKIEYVDRDKKERVVRITPKLLSNNLQEFIQCVKAVNKEVSIKNWTHSFDFDQ